MSTIADQIVIACYLEIRLSIVRCVCNCIYQGRRPLRVDTSRRLQLVHHLRRFDSRYEEEIHNHPSRTVAKCVEFMKPCTTLAHWKRICCDLTKLLKKRVTRVRVFPVFIGNISMFCIVLFLNNEIYTRAYISPYAGNCVMLELN